jgi:hypothetical protein
MFAVRLFMVVWNKLHKHKIVLMQHKAKCVVGTGGENL